MKKIIKTADIKELLSKLDNGEITTSKFAEIINKKIDDYQNKEEFKNPFKNHYGEVYPYDLSKKHNKNG